MKYKMIAVSEETFAHFTRVQQKLTVERGGIRTSQDATMRKLLGLKKK